MNDPTYAVIVVTYHRDVELQETLQSIWRQTVGRDAMEVCVVNNGGTDRARRNWAQRVDVWVDSPENLGCAGGRNRGVEATRAPILVFVDDDGLIDPDFVERLGEVLDRGPEIIAVRGRAVALHHPILSAMARHYDRGLLEAQDLVTLEGGCAIRRLVYEAAGGYEAGRAYHEGIELSGRLLEACPDGRILYTPRAVLRHDFLQGWPHLLRKAKMLETADQRTRAETDPRLERMLRRARALNRIEHRLYWQVRVSEVLETVFKWAKQYYQWRARR